MAYLNEGLGLVGTLGVGAIIGGPVGLGNRSGWFISKIWYAGVQFMTKTSKTQWQIINRNADEIFTIR